MTIPEFVQLTLKVGRKTPLWVQGAGGNTSLKLNGQMLIKASGKRLDAASKMETFACVDLSGTREKLKRTLPKMKTSSSLEEAEVEYESLLAEPADANSWKNIDPSIQIPVAARPSMEMGFHALLPRNVILHFHPVTAVLMAHSAKKESVRWNSFLNKNAILRVALLPAERPGLLLTKQVQAETESDIIILENHGVILQMNSSLGLDQWLDFEKQFLSEWSYDPVLCLSVWPELLQKRPFAQRVCEVPLLTPDAAVYSQELASFKGQTLEAVYRQAEEVMPGHDNKMKNLLELVVAGEFLKILQPELKDLDGEVIRSISNLASEKYRKGNSVEKK